MAEQQLSAYERDKREFNDWIEKHRTGAQEMYSTRVSELDQSNLDWMEKNRDQFDFKEKFDERLHDQDMELREHSEEFDKERRGILEKWSETQAANQEWYEQDQKLREAGAGEDQIENARRGYLREVSEKWGQDFTEQQHENWLAECPENFQGTSERMAAQNFQQDNITEIQPKNSYAIDLQTRDGLESNGKYQYKPGGKTNGPLAAGEWAKRRDNQQKSDMQDIQDRIDDPKTSPVEREKLGLLKDIQTSEIGIAQERSYASKLDSGIQKQEHLSSCESRNSRLCEMKQEWNRRAESNPDMYQKIDVTDDLGHERSPENCRGQAMQHARSAKMYIGSTDYRNDEKERISALYVGIGTKSDYQLDHERSQQQKQSAQQETPEKQGDSKLEQAQASNIPTADPALKPTANVKQSEAESKNTVVTQMENKFTQQQEVKASDQEQTYMERSESKTPAVKPVEQQRQEQQSEEAGNQIERPQWSKDRGAQARQALQQREQEMAHGKGQERHKEYEQSV